MRYFENRVRQASTRACTRCARAHASGGAPTRVGAREYWLTCHRDATQARTSGHTRLRARVLLCIALRRCFRWLPPVCGSTLAG
eukprot:2814533-Pleurochrysis_carterae.AAC.1